MNYTAFDLENNKVYRLVSVDHGYGKGLVGQKMSVFNLQWDRFADNMRRIYCHCLQGSVRTINYPEEGGSIDVRLLLGIIRENGEKESYLNFEDV